MAKKPKRSKSNTAYRVKRAKRKKPIRLLEIGIFFLFLIVVAYAASFTIQITKGYSQETEPNQYFLNLQVLNGCGEKGLANRLANKIEMAVEKPLAVRIIDTDNFDNFGIEKTFVISSQEDLSAANILAEQLGLDEAVTYRKIDDNYLDIGATLVLGKDWQEVLGIEKFHNNDD